jgi:hypothetical protein
MLNTNGWSERASSAVAAADGRQMPLVRSGKCSESGKALLLTSPHELFPSSRAPDAVLAGLLLYLDCWDDAHTIAQEIPTADGSYWHAIIHRMEPDAGNSGYWFRHMGRHTIFPELQKRAQTIARRNTRASFAVPPEWNPFQFIEFCERAAERPGSENEQVALEIQQAEWELLMQWCHG